RSADLRANARITRLQCAVPQIRPVGAHGVIKDLAARGVDRIVDGRYPLHVRPETRLTGQIERDVDAEPTRHRDRIDQSVERRSSGEGEIDAPTEIGRRDGRLRNPLDRPREGWSVKPGSIDQKAASNGGRIV